MLTLEQRNAKLDAAKALVLKGWCQGTLARDAQDRRCSPIDQQATNFCVVGALRKAANVTGTFTPWEDALFIALRRATVVVTGSDNVGSYNDAPGRTKYEVAALFDHAKEQPLE